MRMWTKSMAVMSLVLISSVANGALNTTTYVSIDGAGAGSVTGDMSGVGEVTLHDSDGGDMWNNGDNFIYQHSDQLVTGDFTATVRVIGQTEAIDGRWGKAGIRANASLNGDSSSAMAQVAAGNGSQPSGANPVPARLAGRATNGTNDGGYENPILDAAGAEVPNDVFRTDGGVNASWLRLDYTAADNAFVSGIAPDVDGMPGEWSFSAAKTDVEATGDGWYLGIAYSVHDDMSPVGPPASNDLATHGVVFDNYQHVPEPSSVALIGLGMLSLVGLRRRKR